MISRYLPAVLFGFLLLTSAAHACIHYIEENPVSTEPPSLREALLQHESREVWQARVEERQKVADTQWDFRTQNNLAAALVHVGRLDEAMNRFQTIERVLPGHAYTAFNIATVHELKGDLPHALKWVKIGLEREAKSASQHRLDDTEWLHVRILEARLRHKYAPETVGQNSIAGVDFGSSKQPQTPHELPLNAKQKPLTLPQVQKALFEQTHERLQFVPAPDAVVGDLLFDLGNIAALQGDTKGAVEVLAMSLEYSPTRRSLVQKRFNHLSGATNGALWIGFFGLVGLSYGGWTWKRAHTEKQAWRTMPVEKLDDVASSRPPVCIDFSDVTLPEENQRPR